MAVSGFELYQVTTEFVTVDLIVWNRYRNRAPGIVEKTLDANPQLAVAHRTSPFLPVGLLLRLPIDNELMTGRPQQIPSSSIWTE